MAPTTPPPRGQRSRWRIGWGRPRLHRPVLSALIAAVAGILAAAFGAGIGIRHLQETGLSAESIIGLALLIIGLALLGFAGVGSWRAASGWRRLWLAPATLLTLIVIWSITLAVMYTNVPRTALESITPADRGLAYTDAVFTTSDGVRLSAWLVPSRNRAAVILLHGAGENRTATLPQAVVLARHGFGMLLVDARGQGRSGGHGMDLGWYGDADVTAAATFLQHRPEIDPARIAVLGLSMAARKPSAPPPITGSTPWSPKEQPNAPPPTKPAGCPAA